MEDATDRATAQRQAHEHQLGLEQEEVERQRRRYYSALLPEKRQRIAAAFKSTTDKSRLLPPAG